MILMDSHFPGLALPIVIQDELRSTSNSVQAMDDCGQQVKNDLKQSRKQAHLLYYCRCCVLYRRTRRYYLLLDDAISPDIIPN